MDKEKYRIIEEFSFDYTLPFLVKELKRKKRTPYLIGFIGGFLTLLLAGILLFIFYFDKYTISVWNILLAFLSSFVILLLIAPIHELIHGIGFRIEGAKKIKYGILWKSLAAYAVAEDFECNYKQYCFIALLPFIILSVILIIPPFIHSIPIFWRMVSYFVLLQHYLSCIGDFLSLSYFYRFKNRNIITWDDVENRITYYAEKI